MAGDIGGFLGGFSGSVIGSAVVNLYLDSKAYQAELAKTSSTTGTASAGMTSKLSQFKAIGGMAFAAVGTAAVAFAAKSVQAASDQEEAFNKVQEIFGNAAGSVNAFAEDAATSLGMSETAALSAAGTFGNLFVNVGFAENAAADMSTELVTLAADLASFNNLDPTEALDKLRAGLAGESEPLRAVGVFLSEAKVEAEAYSAGIAKVGAELTDQQKIQARYNLILEETQLAQGDFERTSGSLANQQRSLTAQFEDLSASVGAVLTPILEDFLKVLGPTVKGLGDLLGKFEEFQAAGEKPEAGLLDQFKALLTSSLPDLAGAAWRGLTFESLRAADAAEFVRDEFAETGTATRELGATVRKAGGAHRRFAEMSREALKEYRGELTETFTTSDDVFSGLAEKSHVTAKQVIQAFHRQNKALTNYAENVQTVKKRGLEDDVLQALSDLGLEGADILEGLAHASKREIAEMNRTFDTNVEKTDEVTGSILDVDDAVKKLDGKKAHTTVTVEYKVAGVNPDSLPGVGTP